MIKLWKHVCQIAGLCCWETHAEATGAALCLLGEGAPHSSPWLPHRDERWQPQQPHELHSQSSGKNHLLWNQLAKLPALESLVSIIIISFLVSKCDMFVSSWISIYCYLPCDSCNIQCLVGVVSHSKELLILDVRTSTPINPLVIEYTI